jgi:glycosyltransferase involved in cell wall biosynthesis
LESLHANGGFVLQPEAGALAMTSSNGEKSDAEESGRPTTGNATIVVCTRDRAALLESALARLIVASGDAAILVVDSGSTTTATQDVARIAGVRYVRSDVPGLSIARNLGLERASGDYVVYTDDDCIVDPGFLPPLLAPFTDSAVGAVTGRLVDASQDSNASTEPVQVLDRTSSGLDAGHGALMAFRASVLRELGGFDPVLGAGRRFGGAEDLDAISRVLHSGRRVVRVPRAIVTHMYTRDNEAYENLNENYGLGIGAMCGKWTRGTGLAGYRLTALVLRRALVRYARRFRQSRTRHGQAAYIRGFFRGLRESRRIPIRGGLFVDTNPPAPVLATAAEVWQ